MLLLSPGVFLVVFFSILWIDYQLDDALIYATYLKRWQSGFGLVFNVGEHINALTSFLFSMLAGLISVFGGNPIWILNGMSGFFLAATAMLAPFTFSVNQSDRLWPLMVSLSISGCSLFYYSFGLETTLYLFLITLSLFLFKKRSKWVYFVLACLVITRTEGVFLAGLLALYSFFVHKSRNWFVLTLSAVVFSSQYVFNLLYYDAVVPLSAEAKVLHGASGLWTNVLELRPIVDRFMGGNLIAFALLSATSFYGVVRVVKEVHHSIFILFIGLVIAFYAKLNIPNYHWYYAPIFYCLLVYSVVGVSVLMNDWHQYLKTSFFYGTLKRMRVNRFVGLPLLILWIYPLRTYFFEPQDPISRSEYKIIGEWLKENASPGQTVACAEIGFIGYYSGIKVVDILGLITPKNAKYIAEKDYSNWAEDTQPDFIVVRDPLAEYEIAAERLMGSGKYTISTEINLVGYMLLEKSSRHE